MARIDELFRMLVSEGGSDLHLACGRKPMIRESGEIVPLDRPEFTPDDLEATLFEIMPARNRTEFDAKSDTDFAYEIEGLGRFRANVLRTRTGIAGVFRVIPSEILSAEQLNLPKGVTDLCHLSKGLVVVTGPTGSGKSTTLAAMIDLINRTRSGHIITVEDPIEFVHQEKQCLITQREVHTHTQSFSSALRAALREDPDIVLVGEMRDLETMEIAIETAETGHLVFGTLHTNTAVSTVDRIIDSFPSTRQNQIRAMLANSLKGAVAQTLCRKKPKGRVAALELMVVTRGISSLIRDGKIHQVASAMQAGRAQGMMLLNDSLVDLVTKGLVDPMEAYVKAVDKDELLAKFKTKDIPLPDLGSAQKSGDHAPATAPAPAPLSPAQKPAAPAPAPAPLAHAVADVSQPPSSSSAAAAAPKPKQRILGLKRAPDNTAPLVKEVGTVLEIAGATFRCSPITQAALGNTPTVFVVLNVDAWGKWTVIDAGQSDAQLSAAQNEEREQKWLSHCPINNLWLGVCSTVENISSQENRLATEVMIRRQHGLGSPGK